MSWQEELRRLDADLSAGRIGHAEHRSKREELLAEASGGGAASPVASPLRPAGLGATNLRPPMGPASGRWKGAEPVRWTSAQGGPGGPESGGGQGGSAQGGNAAAAGGPGSGATVPTTTAGATGDSTAADSNGTTGRSGTAGASGPGGTADMSGPAETSGTAGSPGAGETPGAAGMPGAAGTPGATGTSSAAGTYGAAGAPSGASTYGAAGTTGAAGTAGAASAAGQTGTNGATTPGTWSSANPATQQPAGWPPAAAQPTVPQSFQQQSFQPNAQQATTPQPTWHPVQPGVGEAPAAASEGAKARSKPAKGFKKGSTAKAPGWEPKAVGDFHTNRRTTAPSPADVNPTDYLDVSGNQLGHQPTPEMRRLWEEAPPRRRRPTWLFLSLGVLLALVLIVGLTWYIGSKPDQRGSADSVSAPPVPSPSGSADPSATLEDKLPALPGTPSQDNSTMSLDKAVELKAISQADADLMKTAKATEVVYRSYADAEQAGNGTVLLAVPAASPAQAAQLVKGLQGNLVAGGFDSAGLGPAPTDLLYSGSNPAGRVLAFWYTSGPVAIGIGVSEPLTGDAAALRSRIEQIRTKVAAVLPAG